MKLPLRSACALGLGFCAGSSVVLAESTGKTGISRIEEVVVSAQRREQNLQDVPISVNAFSADMVADRRITDIQGLSTSIPSFSINALGKSRTNPSLRGGASSLNSAGAEQAVGLYIDDQYFGGAGDFELDLFDIERIEVLRGPQGTLFGRNTTGGSINIVTRKPSEELTGKLEATVGNYNAIEVRGYLSGPITEDVLGSIAISSRKRDGTSENLLTGHDLEDVDRQSFRGKLLWSVNEDLDVTAALGYSKANEYGQARDAIFIDEPITHQGLIDIGFVPENDPRKVSHADGSFESEQWTFNLRGEYQLSNATILSISTYRDFDSDEKPTSLIGSAVPIYEIGEPRGTEAFSQEFRYTSAYDGSFNWVGGLYYFESDETRDNNSTSSFDPNTILGVYQSLTFCPVQDFDDFEAFVVTPACITDYPQVFDSNSHFVNERNQTTSYSVFADGTYQLTEKFTVLGGFRYTRDKKEFDAVVGGGPDFFWNPPTSTDIDPATGVFVTGQTVSESKSWSKTTYRAGLQYDLTENTMVYSTFSTGFRSGVYDATQSDPALVGSPVDPETAESLEIGLKSRWLDDRLQFNLTWFDVEYDNLQFFVNTGNSSVSTNAGTAQVDGVEVELIAVLTDYLTISANYAHQNGDSEGIPAEAGITEGTPPQGTIPESYMLAVDFDYPLANGNVITAHIDYSHKDSYGLEFNDVPQFISETDSLVNARFGLELVSGWSFSVWGQNLTDEDIIQYGNDFWIAYYDINAAIANSAVTTETSQPRYTPPRTYGATFSYSF